MRCLLTGLAAVLVVPFGHVAECSTVSMEYMGHTYHYFTGTANYNNAITSCESKNSHLVFLETETEADTIHDWVNSKGSNTYWIGLIRKSDNVRSPWVWSDSTSEPISGQDLNYNKFKEGEEIQDNKDRAFVDAEFWITEEGSAEISYVCEAGDSTGVETTAVTTAAPDSITIQEATNTTEKTTAPITTTTQEATTTLNVTAPEATTTLNVTTPEAAMTKGASTTLVSTTTLVVTPIGKTTTLLPSPTTTQEAQTTQETPTKQNEQTTRGVSTTQEEHTRREEQTTQQARATQEKQTTKEAQTTQELAIEEATATQGTTPTPKQTIVPTNSLSEELSTTQSGFIENTESSKQQTTVSVSHQQEALETTASLASSSIPNTDIKTSETTASLASRSVPTTDIETNQVTCNVTDVLDNRTGCAQSVTPKAEPFDVNALLGETVTKSPSPMFTESDRRLSAIVVGSFGLFLFLGFIVFIMLLDLSTISRDFALLKRNLNCKERGVRKNSLKNGYEKGDKQKSRHSKITVQTHAESEL